MNRIDWFPILTALFVVGIVLALIFGVAHVIQARADCDKRGGTYLTWKGGDACIAKGGILFGGP